VWVDARTEDSSVTAVPAQDRDPREAAWTQLLEYIERGTVIPVIGPELLKLPESAGSKGLYTHVAAELARTFKLDVDVAAFSSGAAALDAVACTSPQIRKEVYVEIPQILRQIPTTASPQALMQLAAVEKFRLFVTLTFDSLLERVLQERRGPGRVLGVRYCPMKMEDIPKDWQQRGHSIVYHLLGAASAIPGEYVVTERDLLEFVHSLQGGASRRLKNLFREFDNCQLLLIGCALPDWLARFFLRATATERLWIAGRCGFIADSRITSDAGLQGFLARHCPNTWIMPEHDPERFVQTLCERWDARHPEQRALSQPIKGQPVSMLPVDRGAVFISYPKESEAEARRVAAKLTAGRIKVFLDTTHLGYGEAWERTIRESIEASSVFVPVISKAALGDGPRFVYSEWRQAIKRANSFPIVDGKYLFPVVVDATSVADPRIPEEFRAPHTAIAPGGEVPDAYVEAIRERVVTYQRATAPQ
jgi:hypothetical protein